MVDLEKDVLLQWIGLIFMTLEELHVDKVGCLNPKPHHDTTLELHWYHAE